MQPQSSEHKSVPAPGSSAPPAPKAADGQTGRGPRPVRTFLGLLLIIAVGVGLGYLASLFHLNHPKGLILKFLVALPLAVAGWIVWVACRFRLRLVLLLAGLGAASTMLSIHYFDYQRFFPRSEPELRDVLEARAIRLRVNEAAARLNRLEQGVARHPPEERKELEAKLQKIRDGQKTYAILQALSDKLADPAKEQRLQPILVRFPQEMDRLCLQLKEEGLEQMALGDRERLVPSLLGPWASDFGFGEYLELQARRDRFGHPWAYFYWVVEVMIAAVVAAGIMYLFVTGRKMKWFPFLKAFFAPKLLPKIVSSPPPPPGGGNAKDDAAKVQ